MDPKTKRFLWGTALAWIPWVPTLIGLGYAFRGISSSKATGIGVAAAGLAEMFVAYGIGAIVVGEIAAIVLLSRAFSPGHKVRGFFSILSICLGGSMLILIGLFLWLFWLRARLS